ncbi:sensor histidine kinase [Nonomuraea sp. NPDC050328]|uniref:sensor histidine kinase n=1 Tax=Nonomuraea sp. NPDC050328 TaxID=3364361 RepID=UPI0037BDE573
MEGARVRAHVIAPVRGLALAGLAAVGWPVLAVLFVAVHAGLPSPAFFVVQARRLPALARRLAGRWGGVTIPAPYLPEPPPPGPDAEGWYRDGDDLYRSAFVPAYLARLRWVARDPATWRDLAWLAVEPVVGGTLAGVGPALIGGGLVAAWSGWPVAGVAGVLAGLAVGPVSLRLHARWTRVLLARAARPGPGRVVSALGRHALAAARLWASVGLAVVAVALAVAHIGTIVATAMRLWPETVLASRRFVARRRERFHRWTGARIAEPYRLAPVVPEPDADGSYRVVGGEFGAVHRSAASAARALRWQWTVRDPASWRDLAWLALELPAGLVLAGPAVLVAGGLAACWAWVWLTALRLLGADLPWPLEPWPPPAGLSWTLGLWIPLAGLGAALAGAAVAPALLRLHARLSATLLGPTRAAVLAHRVSALSTSRTELGDAQAAELRRIERDLHDGAQARWIAVGMTLGAAEDLIARDPEAARDLVSRAKDLSVTALGELRELIRGIHPPVLADRGLPDAVRTLALDAPLDVEVQVDLPGTVPPPIAAAVYFAVSELLANAARHADATRVRIELRHSAGVLAVSVADDGRGGASAGPGGGLAGIRRRLSGFDGLLTLSSPPGGPTVATLEIPCALSSPRTSSSSGKDSLTC